MKDAALIALAQRIAHYQIAAYSSAGTMARQLDYAQIDALLKESLVEESAALVALTEIAESAENLVLVCAYGSNAFDSTGRIAQTGDAVDAQAIEHAQIKVVERLAP